MAWCALAPLGKPAYRPQEIGKMSMGPEEWGSPWQDVPRKRGATDSKTARTPLGRVRNSKLPGRTGSLGGRASHASTEEAETLVATMFRPGKRRPRAINQAARVKPIRRLVAWALARDGRGRPGNCFAQELCEAPEAIQQEIARGYPERARAVMSSLPPEVQRTVARGILDAVRRKAPIPGGRWSQSHGALVREALVTYAGSGGGVMDDELRDDLTRRLQADGLLSLELPGEGEGPPGWPSLGAATHATSALSQFRERLRLDPAVQTRHLDLVGLGTVPVAEALLAEPEAPPGVLRELTQQMPEFLDIRHIMASRRWDRSYNAFEETQWADEWLETVSALAHLPSDLSDWLLAAKDEDLGGGRLKRERAVARGLMRNPVQWSRPQVRRAVAGSRDPEVVDTVLGALPGEEAESLARTLLLEESGENPGLALLTLSWLEKEGRPLPLAPDETGPLLSSPDPNVRRRAFMAAEATESPRMQTLGLWDGQPTRTPQATNP